MSDGFHVVHLFAVFWLANWSYIQLHYSFISETHSVEFCSMWGRVTLTSWWWANDLDGEIAWLLFTCVVNRVQNAIWCTTPILLKLSKLARPEIYGKQSNERVCQIIVNRKIKSHETTLHTFWVAEDMEKCGYGYFVNGVPSQRTFIDKTLSVWVIIFDSQTEKVSMVKIFARTPMRILPVT